MGPGLCCLRGSGEHCIVPPPAPALPLGGSGGTGPHRGLRYVLGGWLCASFPGMAFLRPRLTQCVLSFPPLASNGPQLCFESQNRAKGPIMTSFEGTALHMGCPSLISPQETIHICGPHSFRRGRRSELCSQRPQTRRVQPTSAR